MFAGSSDGAFAALYLAQALTRGRTGEEALRDCIEFQSELIKTFRVTPRIMMRLASGLLSMFDGAALSRVLKKHYNQGRSLGDETLLGELSWAVSIESYNSRTRETITYTNFNHPETTLVNAALSSTAFVPLLPAFRDTREGVPYRNDTLFDGALSSNAPILLAISDGIRFLRGVQPGGGAAANAYICADDHLRDLTMLSMGSDVFVPKPIQDMLSVSWPPFGLKKDPVLNQYGLLWSQIAKVSWVLTALIQRQATDESRFARMLLGDQRFLRFSPIAAGVGTIMEMLLTPGRFLESARRQAEAALQGEAMARLDAWVENYWMRNPPLSSTEAPPVVKLGSVK